VTGRLREVDASIRYRVGSSEILITVECRARNRPADSRWVEELASKRAQVGAARTIAVAKSGFTESARRAAVHYSIDLRTLSEVDAADIDGWFLPGAVHVFRDIAEVECEVSLATVEPGEEVSFKIDPWESIFFHDLVASPFPAAMFLQFLELTQSNRFWSIPLDGRRTRMEFDIDATAEDLIPLPLGVPRGNRTKLGIKLSEEFVVVRRLRISALVSYESAVCRLDEGKHHVYTSADGSRIQHTTFETGVFGFPARFDHQKAENEEPTARAELGPKKLP
jgi:hypothetical protein